MAGFPSFDIVDQEGNSLELWLCVDQGYPDYIWVFYAVFDVGEEGFRSLTQNKFFLIYGLCVLKDGKAKFFLIVFKKMERKFVDVEVFTVDFKRSLSLETYLAVEPALDHAIIGQRLS